MLQFLEPCLNMLLRMIGDGGETLQVVVVLFDSLLSVLCFFLTGTPENLYPMFLLAIVAVVGCLAALNIRLILVVCICRQMDF